MKSITTKQFQIMTDVSAVWELMVDAYVPCCENGIAAPFFEYALMSTWMNKDYLHYNRLWLDGDRVVGFAFYENPVSCIFFNLLPGYDELADEMVDYAVNVMPAVDGEKELVFFPGQTALMEAAGKRGFALEYESSDHLLDFEKTELAFDLPEGYHFVDFVDPSDIDIVKLAECTWKGFDHEDKGSFENWDAPDPGTLWNPQKSYNGILGPTIAPPPHSTFEHNVIIADEKGDYVCFSGMWWVERNKLAYMEPLCTVPEHRGKGLAAAALTRHYRRFKPMGARYMTGGESDFYKKIGYTSAVRWLHWKKK